MKKILFITAHRKDRAPNQRFRFEQYFSFLSENGFECVLSPLIITKEEDTLFYSKGNYLKKIPLGIKFAFRRIKDVIRSRKFDVIFIAREAFMLGVPFFEKLLAKGKAKVIFDFDDAIWMDVISSNNRKFSWLKDGSKTGKIVNLATIVFAGNAYLAEFARKFNGNVVIIPTTIDTELYHPTHPLKKKKIVIGWSGSVSTIEHFQHALPALKIVKLKYGKEIEMKVIGDVSYANQELEIVGSPWKWETELSDLQTIDIGIMPLPDNEWTWGKCGLKGLQYMALEIPTIMSPVGVNKEIIVDGENGFLAEGPQEWADKISRLIDSKILREKIGKAGRQTVIKKYSVVSQQQNYISHFMALVK